MPIRLSPVARRHIREILRYTRKTWGDQQELRYAQGLDSCLKGLDLTQRGREFSREFPNVLYVKYESHVIFFRRGQQHRVDVLAVLHGQMDLPSQLRRLP